jgi:hypothetical protein
VLSAYRCGCSGPQRGPPVLRIHVARSTNSSTSRLGCSPSRSRRHAGMHHLCRHYKAVRPCSTALMYRPTCQRGSSSSRSRARENLGRPGAPRSSALSSSSA